MMNYRKILLYILILGWSSVMAQEKPLVVGTASMFSDMTKNIAGDLVDIKTIVPVGSDPHLHESTPSDAQLVVDADLILVNALTFEGWIDELIENSGSKARVDTITKNVNAILSVDYQGSADPHAWMRADNGRIYARNIANALKKLDPKNAASYEANLKAYDTKLKELHNYINGEVAKIPKKKRILITSHDAFSYYGKAYGIQLEPLTGISTEAEVQTSDIMRVAKTINESEVTSIFTESTINPKLLKQLAADQKVEVGAKLFADSLDDEGKPAGTYIGMLKSNTDSIVKGLMKESSAVVTNKNSDLGYIKWILGFLGLILIGGLFFFLKGKNQ